MRAAAYAWPATDAAPASAAAPAQLVAASSPPPPAARAAGPAGLGNRIRRAWRFLEKKRKGYVKHYVRTMKITQHKSKHFSMKQLENKININIIPTCKSV